ncbi:lupus La protein homolog [Caerostris extrusa]|uniref:Lupus La protein homolog n=1 Tax=Caerostris extrusa TaxID=172846 RepID=A0AAV4WBM7_CAEEX|nr:lupus La protein homolog [Caerostris extrusa]
MKWSDEFRILARLPIMGTEDLSTTAESGKDTSELQKKIIRQIEANSSCLSIPSDHEKLTVSLAMNDSWSKIFIHKKSQLWLELSQTVDSLQGFYTEANWGTLEVMVKFNRLKSLSQNFEVICTALSKSPNDLIEVSEDSTKIRRRVEKPIPDSTSVHDAMEERTLYVKGFKKNNTLDELLDFFKDYKVEHVTMRKRFQNNNRTFKGSCFVLFETVKDAQDFLDNKNIKFEGTELLKEKRKKKKKAKNKKEDENEKNKEVPEIDIIPGCLVKVTELSKNLSREDIKDALAEFGNISFVDFFRGQPEAVVRFETSVAANVLEKAKEEDGVKKFDIGSCKAIVSVLEGDAEKDYWKTIAISRANRKQKFPNQKGKGRFGKKNFGKRQKGNREDDRNQPPSKKSKTDSKEDVSECREANGKDNNTCMEHNEAEKATVEAS